MSYVRLVPSMADYAESFKQLDPLDFKIVKGLYRFGVSNISRLAKIMGVPQQTLSYHLKKFDKQDLVRFRALINEVKLGLKSYAVLARTPIDREVQSSRAMTCFPLWRYLAIVDGWRRGNYVRFVIPPDKERDLKLFLEEIRKRELITDFELTPSTSSAYPLLNLDFYAQKSGFAVFDWNAWAKDFDSFAEEQITEPASYEKAKFDLYDLIILRCFEINARTRQRKIVKEIARIVGDDEYKKYVPLVSRRIREDIHRQGLVRGIRTYLFPSSASTALFLMYRFVFSNSSNVKRFVNGLNRLPFITGYEKLLKKDELFVRFVMPTHEFSNMRKSLTRLAENGSLKNAHLFFGALPSTWDNVEIYQMFKDETWNFSFGIAIEMLEKVLSRK